MDYKDYYKILGVAKSADEKAVKTAYRRLARKYHPDVSKSKDSASRFQEISEAYEVLGDPEKRKRYDTLGPDWQRFAQAGAGARSPSEGAPFGQGEVHFGSGGAGAGFSDFFRTIFGDDHAWGPISNLTINDNLVADGGDNGAIATGNAGDGNQNVKITNNRLSYVYSTSMPTGGSSAATWTGNYRDDTLASVAVGN